MSEIQSSSKKVSHLIPNMKIPIQIRRLEDIQKIKASKEIKKRLEESKRIEKILKKNKELFDFKTLNCSIDSKTNDKRCLSFKTIEKESSKNLGRNISLLWEEKKNSFYKEFDRDEYDSAIFRTSNKSKEKSNKLKLIKLQKAMPKIDVPLTKPIKINHSVVKQNDKDTFFHAIKKLNTSVDTTSNNGNTIINIHNNINIKIKDNQIPLENCIKPNSNNKKDRSIITKSLNTNDFTIKYSPVKQLKEKVKTNNYMSEHKEQKLLDKKTVAPSILLNNKNLLNSHIPLKLVNINPKLIKLSSLLKQKNKNNITSSKIEVSHNENSIISFDESIISKRKKDSNPSQSQEKVERNEEISLSYSEDEKTNKPIKVKNPDKSLKKLMNSFDGYEDQSDNETEFIKFCENLNRKILNK